MKILRDHFANCESAEQCVVDVTLCGGKISVMLFSPNPNADFHEQVKAELAKEVRDVFWGN